MHNSDKSCPQLMHGPHRRLRTCVGAVHSPQRKHSYVVDHAYLEHSAESMPNRIDVRAAGVHSDEFVQIIQWWEAYI